MQRTVRPRSPGHSGNDGVSQRPWCQFEERVSEVLGLRSQARRRRGLCKDLTAELGCSCLVGSGVSFDINVGKIR